MLTQIYEITSPEEAQALSRIGIDHIGILVGEGAFPREIPIGRAREIMNAIEPPSKASVLTLAPDIASVRALVDALRPPILHIGSQLDEIGISDVRSLKTSFPGVAIMRSIPVSGRESLSLAKSWDGAADFLLLDTYRAEDRQFGALGITHDWALDRAIVEAVAIPVIIAGGLGPENVADAIRAIRPTGVDSKTRTDKSDGSHTKDLEKVR